MAKRSCASVILLALLISVAGCGGDGDGSSTTETDTGDAARLTDAQWSEYESAKTSFVSAREAATAKLDQCPDTTADEFSACIGSTLDDLESAATALGDMLSGLEGTVTGRARRARPPSGAIPRRTPTRCRCSRTRSTPATWPRSRPPRAPCRPSRREEGEETEAFEEACARPDPGEPWLRRRTGQVPRPQCLSAFRQPSTSP